MNRTKKNLKTKGRPIKIAWGEHNIKTKPKSSTFRKKLNKLKGTYKKYRSDNYLPDLTISFNMYIGNNYIIEFNEPHPEFSTFLGNVGIDYEQFKTMYNGEYKLIDVRKFDDKTVISERLLSHALQFQHSKNPNIRMTLLKSNEDPSIDWFDAYFKGEYTGNREEGFRCVPLSVKNMSRMTDLEIVDDSITDLYDGEEVVFLGCKVVGMGHMTKHQKKLVSKISKSIRLPEEIENQIKSY